MKRGRRPDPLRDDAVRSALLAGNTYTETAAQLGMPYWLVRQIAVRLGITPTRDGRADRQTTIDPRAPMMAALYTSGQTLRQIGDTFGITRERVRQILRKRTVVTREEGGQAVQTRRRRAERATKRDQAYMARLGCGYEEYQRIKAIGRGMLACGKSKQQTPMGAFLSQKNNAARRKIGWELNFWQWWSVWRDSGKWAERGRGNGYVMCRRGDVGPYALGNIFIASSRENVSSGPHKKSGLPIGVQKSRNGTFLARRQMGARLIHLGTFPTPELAHAAYLASISGSSFEKRAA